MAFQSDTFQTNAFQISPSSYNQGISLGLNGGLVDSALLAALNNLGLGLTSGMSVASALQAINALNLLLTGGFSVQNNPAATGAFDGGTFQSNAFQVNNVYSLNVALGLSGVFQASFGAIYNMALSLGLTAGDLGLANNANLNATLAVAATLGIAEAQQLIMSQNVAMSATLAESVANVAALSGGINLSAVLGESVDSTALMNAMAALVANGGFQPQTGGGNVYALAVALGLTSAVNLQAGTIMSQSISLPVTAVDLNLIQAITKGLSRWRPVRYFLSRKYRSVALSPRDPDNNDWDWR